MGLIQADIQLRHAVPHPGIVRLQRQRAFQRTQGCLGALRLQCLGLLFEQIHACAGQFARQRAVCARRLLQQRQGFGAITATGIQAGECFQARVVVSLVPKRLLIQSLCFRRGVLQNQNTGQRVQCIRVLRLQLQRLTRGGVGGFQVFARKRCLRLLQPTAKARGALQLSPFFTARQIVGFAEKLLGQGVLTLAQTDQAQGAETVGVLWNQQQCGL